MLCFPKSGFNLINTFLIKCNAILPKLVKFYKIYYRYEIAASESISEFYPITNYSIYNEIKYTFTETFANDKSLILNIYCDIEYNDGYLSTSFSKLELKNKIFMNSDPIDYNISLNGLLITYKLSDLEIFRRAVLIENLKCEFENENLVSLIQKIRNCK